MPRGTGPRKAQLGEAPELATSFSELHSHVNVQEPRQAAGAQVADALVPHQDAAGNVPRRAVRSHRSRSVRRLPIDRQSLEVALSNAWLANAPSPWIE